MTWLRLLYRVTALVALVLAGAATAQTSASHQVAISIPTLLRLRVDHLVTSDHASVPVNVHVEGSLHDIEPAATRVEVLANTAWELSVRDASGADANGLALRWHALGASGAVRVSPSIVASGGPTRGWRAIDVGYAVANEPADGTHRAVVAYTLVRP